MRCGQVIGSTDRLGGEVDSRPVTFPEVFATLYHNIGLDVERTREFDAGGVPRNLVADGIHPMRELI